MFILFGTRYEVFRSLLLLFAMLVVGFGTARSQQFFALSFDGNDPSQPVTTPGTGSGWAILSADKTQLTYTFAFGTIKRTRDGNTFPL